MRQTSNTPEAERGAANAAAGTAQRHAAQFVEGLIELSPVFVLGFCCVLYGFAARRPRICIQLLARFMLALIAGRLRLDESRIFAMDRLRLGGQYFFDRQHAHRRPSRSVATR